MFNNKKTVRIVDGLELLLKIRELRFTGKLTDSVFDTMLKIIVSYSNGPQIVDALIER